MEENCHEKNGRHLHLISEVHAVIIRLIEQDGPDIQDHDKKGDHFKDRIQFIRIFPVEPDHIIGIDSRPEGKDRFRR
jgi:hypothetical protein